MKEKRGQKGLQEDKAVFTPSIATRREVNGGCKADAGPKKEEGGALLRIKSVYIIGRV